MAFVKGRGVRIELGATYGAAIPVSAVTIANPGVVTATAHGLAEFSAGYFSGVAGMVQIDGQAVQVAGPSTNAFTAIGLNTSNFSDFSSGSFVPVLSWVTLGEATSYTIAIDEATRFDSTTVLDRMRQVGHGILGAQSLSTSVLANTLPSAAALLIESSAQLGLDLVIRITHPDGAVRLARGIPSIPGEDVQQGAVGTSAIVFSIRGFVLKILGQIFVPPPVDTTQTYADATYFAADYVA